MAKTCVFMRVAYATHRRSHPPSTVCTEQQCAQWNELVSRCGLICPVEVPHYLTVENKSDGWTKCSVE